MKKAERKLTTKLKVVLIGLACGVPLVSQATGPGPWTASELYLRTTINVAADAGVTPNSNYNSRIFDGDNFVTQIINSSAAFGRYAAGSSVPSVAVNNTGVPINHRQVDAFRGVNSSTYLLAAGSAQEVTTLNHTFSRYNFDGTGRVTITDPRGTGFSAGSFGWVDADTVVMTTYQGATQDRLYLADVVADPFSMSLNTLWNPNAYIATSSPYIRAVTVGDVYNGYAYYGDGHGGSGYNPNFYALNLSTGVETLLGNWGSNVPAGSYAGIWTVVERDGYLYVQTTGDGIQVYNMTDATTLGSLYTTYSKAQLDALTSYSGQYYGFDVSHVGGRMLLSGSGLTWELAPVVPEPTTLGLLGLGLLLVWRRSRTS